MTCIRCATLLLSSLILPGVTCAAPAVSAIGGSLKLGETVTITGNDFGSHPMQVESLQANIEAGTTGNKLSKAGWIKDWGWADPVYATDAAHSGSKSLKCSLNGSTQYNCAFAYDMPSVAPGQMFYATWWVKYSGDTGGQWKMFRASEQETIVDANQTVALFNWFDGGQLAPIGQPYLWPSYTTYPAGDNKWYRVELIFKASTANTNNGTLTFNRYSDTGTVTGETFSGVKTHEASNDNWNYAIWHNYIGNGINTATIWLDDLYVQHNTPARVELCTGSTWASRGRCEIQIPTTWGSSSITATVNTGAFSESDAAYLYVVDSNGDANPLGVEVEIGESSTPTPIDGVCGSNSGATLTILTSGDANNCSAGTVSGFTGTGPWSWTCAGLNGGSDSGTCSASLSSSLTGNGLRISAGTMTVGVGSTKITPIQ